MTRDEVIRILGVAGFAHQPSAMFEHLIGAFLRPAREGWVLGAHASWDEPAHVDIGLMRDPSGATIGTRHRFRDIGELQRRLAPTIADLEALIAHPDLLKCPLCGRWVVAKEPSVGDTWAPFLSCEGMRIEGRKPNRGPVCRGTSNRIPAVVVYP